jgi:predicted nucleotidyltransferase
MSSSGLCLPAGLPDNVRRFLGDFVADAQRAFADDFVSAVLFGSAAEGALRKSSDVNLLLVLKKYEHTRGEQIRNSLAAAEAAILLRVMFLCEDEIPAAYQAFSLKFSDILRRRAVLTGPDPFSNVVIPRVDQVRRLRQVLLNLLLRLREVHAGNTSASPATLRMLAESSGVLRASAALLLTLQDQDAGSPKQALLQVAEDVAPGRYAATLAKISQLRETSTLPEPDAKAAMMNIMDLAAAMHTRAESLSEQDAKS